VHTLMAQVHFHLQSFEVVGEARLGLIAHLLSRPLLEAAELLVDIHDCGFFGLVRGQFCESVVQRDCGREVRMIRSEGKGGALALTEQLLCVADSYW
jgi:hypothetical protein